MFCLAAYLRALESHGWRAWATGRDGILNLHAARDGREGVFLRFLVSDGVVHELGHPPVTHRTADVLEARLLDHATHTAAFVLIGSDAGDPFPAWLRLATRGEIAPFDPPSPEIELPTPPPGQVQAFVNALAGLEELDPAVGELAAVLDAFAVDTTGTAGVRPGAYRGGSSISISLGHPHGRTWSWLSVEIERTGMCTGSRNGRLRLADPDRLRVWLEERLCSPEGRWIAADVRTADAGESGWWSNEDSPLVPGVSRAGRTGWSDRVEALLAPLPPTGEGLARLEAVRLLAAASGGSATIEAIEGPDAWWRLVLQSPEGRSHVRLLVAGDEVIPPLLSSDDPAEWVAGLIREVRGWAPSPDVAAILAEATRTWTGRGIAAWWWADPEELELRVRPVDSGELVASVVRLAFPVEADGLRERIAAELDGPDALLVLREIPIARGRERVEVAHHSGIWLAREEYQALVARSVSGGPCAITLRAHSAEDALDFVGERKSVDVAGVEVQVERAEISGPAEVLLQGTARFAAEDGRLLV